jgi:indolepyruvate ferredoxin oxidoreductase
MFEGDYKLNYHLAPPLLAKRNDQGELVKNTAPDAAQLPPAGAAEGPARHGLDVFGRTEERRTERALIGQYRASIEELPTLSAANHATGWRSPAFPSRSRATAM